MNIELDHARTVCEIAVSAIPVFALAFLVSDRGKLRVSREQAPPPLPGEIVEYDPKKWSGGTWTTDPSGKTTFMPNVDTSDAEQAVVSLVFLVASLVGFVFGVVAVAVQPYPWILAIVCSSLLISVFLIFGSIAIQLVISSFKWDESETTGSTSIFKLLTGRERVSLKATGQDITVYEQVGLVSLGVFFALAVIGIVGLIALNVILIFFVNVT